MKKEKGFSLIELLIVVAIILIIAAIAVPNLLKSKAAANEASAAASLRTMTSGNFTYSSTYSQGFAGSLAQLGPTSGACATVSSGCADLIDSVLSGVSPAAVPPLKAGYAFVYAAGPTGATPTVTAPNTTFSVLATPTAPGSSGTSTFCVDATFLVKKDPSGSTAGPAGGGCLTFAGLPL